MHDGGVTGPEALEAATTRAFQGVRALPADAIVHEDYRSSGDAQDMAAAFAGRHWTELPLREVFFHRESVFMFSAPGYLSCLPAYLRGCLPDTEYRADIGWYTVSGLETRHRRPTARQRLELFTDDQLAVVTAVLRHVDTTLDDDRIEALLAALP